MKQVLLKYRNIITTLFIFSLPIFFNERFTGGWVSVFVYMLLVCTSIVGSIYLASKRFKINLVLLFVLVLILEMGIYGSFILVQKKIISSPSIQNSYHHFYTTYLRNIPSYQTQLGRYDKELFYTLRPGKGENQNFEFSNAYEINSQGLRDDETSLDDPEVIVLGDSHAMGFGVNQEETFAQVLEKKSKSKVLNSAIISYGTARQYLLFQKLKTDSCKTIVWQYCPNDVVENIKFLENGNQLNISSEQEYRFCQYRNFLQANYYPFKYTFETVAHQLRRLVFWKKSKTKTIDLQTHAQYFFNILKLLRNNFDGEIIVLNLESSETTDALIFEFKKYIQQQNLEKIRCVDFSKKLIPSDFNVIDEHINASGHRKIGRLLYETIFKVERVSVLNNRTAVN